MTDREDGAVAHGEPARRKGEPRDPAPRIWTDLDFRRFEALIVAVSGLAFGVLVVLAARRFAGVYLTPDGAHAVTDARAYWTSAPREPYYLPGFPTVLMPFLQLGISPLGAISAGLALLCAAWFTALYFLARSYASPRAAYFGAVVGAASTPLAELLGWQGGATLLAMVGLTAALAAFDRWSRRRQWSDALLVGVFYAVALATHPFVALFGGILLSLRWAYDVLAERHFVLRGFGPSSFAGTGLAALVPVVALALLASQYLAIASPAGSSLRFPNLAAPADQFAWVARESFLIADLVLVAFAAAIATRGPARLIAGVTAATFVLLPAFLSGDPSYQSRVVYLLPPSLALGGAIVWDRLEQYVGARLRRSHRPASFVARTSAILASCLVVASVGFVPRLRTAARYYSSLSRADLTVIEGVGAAGGTVLTGWTGNRYWEGLSNSWFVEALAGRAAMGPADPALSTRIVERQESAAAWQLFSGSAGVENGALQVSFGPQGWQADPAIAGDFSGYYVPLLSIADTLNDYGPDAASSSSAPISWMSDAAGATGVRRNAAGLQIFDTSVHLEGTRVTLTWTREQTSRTTAWTIWLWPAPGINWTKVKSGSAGIQFVPESSDAYRDPAAFNARRPSVRIQAVGGATLLYKSSGPQLNASAIVIQVPANADLELIVDISGTAPPRTMSAYNERDLIEQYKVRSVLVWRDSGWADRFSTSGCFSAARSDAQIAAFAVTQACQTAGQ